jgi:membrane-associated phospholipid phosphatase
MRFFLVCKPWIIGALLSCSCFGQSASPLSSTPPAGTPPGHSFLFSSANDFFRIHSQSETHPVTISESINNIRTDQKEIWTSPLRLHKSDLRWIAPLAATTGLLIATDHHSASLIHSNQSNRSLSSNFANAGLMTFGGIAASSFAIGAFTRNEHARETGILTGEALANSFLVSEALKFVTQRARPDLGADRGQFWSRPAVSSSFPSQHAALAWAAAAVIAREYPGPVTTWGAYGLASALSISRLTSADHFPSDVLIGAVAGYLIGRHIYNAHHDDRITDRTGSTPTSFTEKSTRRTPAEHLTRAATTGSVYVPLDSWIYPALRRLAALGYIPDQVSGSAPWTRLECYRQVQEAADIAGRREARTKDASLIEEALRLIHDLNTEFGNEAEEGNLVRLESIYTRTTQVTGAPLRDSYHFGQTVANDFGRPYGEGLNNVTGLSAYALSGRFSAYVRGEYQYAPGADAYSAGVRRFIARADDNPLQGPSPISTTSRFQPLEMYVGAQLGFENITFGKQSLWWGPGQDSAFSFSNNAAPFYMLRFAQTRPLILPGPFALLGKIRTEIVFGKLSGHQWPARPYMNAQKGPEG